MNGNQMQLFPGQWSRCENKNEGKALPAGLLRGAIPFTTNDELLSFAKILKMGVAKTLKSWAFAIGDLQEIW